MGLGSDSEGSVQCVEDDVEGDVRVCEPTPSVSRGSNFCLEKDGVPQAIPAATRVTRHSASRPKRIENEGGSRGPPSKRTRQIRDTKKDSDVVEIEETVEADHGQVVASTASNQHRKRCSVRLQQKRETKPAYNLDQLIRDRKKRDRKGDSEQRKPRSSAKVDSIELLDDDEEGQKSLPSNAAKDSVEQLEQRKRGREVVPVEEEEDEEEEEEDILKQSKDTGGVDTPYTGSTHLIFEFPPGERGKIRVTEEERGRLSQRKYLNDSLIDFYIMYHKSDNERRAEELRTKATFFSSFFFGRLRRTEPIDYDGVKGWTKKVDIFETQYVFVPICDSYHWSLIIVANLNHLKKWVEDSEEVSASSTETPRIIYLDSLDPKRGAEFGEIMRQYLVEEWLAKKVGLERNPATRKATSTTFKKVLPILRPNVPIQTNEYDCGLYLLNSFEMFLHNTDGLRDKLLSGYRDVRDAYSHVEITMLRKNIINLMDILESQWRLERLPQGGESGRYPDDVKGSVSEENIAAGAEILASEPRHESLDRVEKLEDGSRGVLTTPNQKASEREARVPCQSQPESADSPEHVSLVDRGAVHNKQPEETENRAMGMDTYSLSDEPDTSSDPGNPDSNTISHSNLPREPTPCREDGDLRESRLTESGDMTWDEKERVTHYGPQAVQEVSQGPYDEGLSRVPNDDHTQEVEVLEVDIQDSE